MKRRISTWTLLGNWKKTMEHENDGDTNCNWCFWYSYRRIDKGTGGLGNEKTTGHPPNYSIIKIGQNTEKSPGDLRRLAVNQTPLRNHQLILAGKNSQKTKIIIQLEWLIDSRLIFTQYPFCPVNIFLFWLGNIF